MTIMFPAYMMNVTMSDGTKLELITAMFAYFQDENDRPGIINVRLMN